jgi:DHA2 family multidrug resistance protein
VLAIGIGAMQLMLDRGQSQDWFNAREVIIEAVLAGLGIYLFVVHMATAKRPFIAPAIFRDLNFTTSLVMMFAVGIVLLASSALLAPYLQTLAGYPVATAGLIMAPRGVGTMVAMMLAGRFANRIDPRLLMAVGILALVASFWSMTGWTPDVSTRRIVIDIVLQGFGLGFVFIPLQVVAFATLDAKFRGDGTALLSLVRNVGSAIGVSVTSFMLAQSIQTEHSVLAAVASPFNRVFQHNGAISRMLDPTTSHGAAMLDQMINQQANSIGYNNDFKLMMLTALPTLLLLLVMRKPKLAAGAPVEAHAAMD